MVSSLGGNTRWIVSTAPLVGLISIVNWSFVVSSVPLACRIPEDPLTSTAAYSPTLSVFPIGVPTLRSSNQTYL